MGVEGKDKAKALEAGAFALSGQLGRAVMRLRTAWMTDSMRVSGRGMAEP